ncbi:MAG: ATPase, partial [Gammaproteobacteria bacterium]|nr:ATPase [Gammaproteobacteria bacterium]
MSLLDQYHQDVQLGSIQFDKAQADALEKLEAVFKALLKSDKDFHWFHQPKPVKGVYLYGSVGVGKTYLMDIFCNHLSLSENRIQRKNTHRKARRVYRTHFHRFLQYIHAELTFYQGKPNPLIQIAKTIARNHRVLCFDELYVSDIGDAMLLGNLFNALFEEEITLIATSNWHPDELYKNGLQRDLFLPAIAALKTHTEIVHVESAMDYR